MALPSTSLRDSERSRTVSLSKGGIRGSLRRRIGWWLESWNKVRPNGRVNRAVRFFPLFRRQVFGAEFDDRDGVVEVVVNDNVFDLGLFFFELGEEVGVRAHRQGQNRRF